MALPDEGTPSLTTNPGKVAGLLARDGPGACDTANFDAIKTDLWT